MVLGHHVAASFVAFYRLFRALLLSLVDEVVVFLNIGHEFRVGFVELAARAVVHVYRLNLLLRGGGLGHEAVDVGRAEDQLLFLRQSAHSVVLAWYVLQPILRVVPRVVLFMGRKPPLGGLFLFDPLVGAHFCVYSSIQFLAVLLDVDLIEHAVVAAQVVVEAAVAGLAAFVGLLGVDAGLRNYAVVVCKRI